MSVVVTVLTVPDADAELAADRLMQHGAFALEERQSDVGRVELRAALGHAATSAFAASLPESWTIGVESVDSEPLDTWRQFAAPIEIADDLVVRPAWQPALARAGVTEVAIEPGAAFGLGDHPTTRLSVAAVWRLAHQGASMLDVGCGTGVLAIAAVLAGAARATAIDIAEPAVMSTGDNAERNGVAGQVVVSTAALADLDGPFDLVAANILAPTLVAMAGDLRRLTATDGTLVISGILADRHDHVLAALQPMIPVNTTTLDGWAAVELRFPGGDRLSGR
jgi:ribosomal protein L11 methyltransferase